MKFKLEIELGNDAMESPGEVIDSVRRSLVKHAGSTVDPLRVGEGGPVLDGNGNRVGEWEVVES